MKYALNRLFVRLALLGVAITMGALAVSQAQKGLRQDQPQELAASATESGQGEQMLAAPTSTVSQTIPIPIPMQTESSDAGSYEAAPPAYSNEIPVYEPSAPADGLTAADADYASDYPPPPPIAATEIQDAATLSQPVPPMAYDLPPAPRESSANYVAAEDPAIGQYEAVQPVQAEVPQSSAFVAAPSDGERGYPDVHDGSRYERSSDALELPPLESAPTSAGQYDAGQAYDDSPAFAAATYQSETNSDNRDNYFPQSDNAPYTGDATFQMQNDRAARDRNGRPDGSFAPIANRAENPSYENDAFAVGNGQPGPEELIGPQTPSLSIRKSAPAEAQVGKPTRLEIVVKNVGKIPAHDVLIRDEVPRGTKMIDTTPAADTTSDGAILWQVGTLEPGAEVTVSMSVMPTDEGEIGSVATISFQVAATARSIVTRPQLTLEHTGPQQVLVGKDVIFNIRLANVGTGVATNVYLEEDVPEGLRHFDGRELEYKVGTIKPGESRVLELKLTADKPSLVRNVLIARGDSKLRVKDEYEFEVVAPNLDLAVDGPKKRFLNRKAVYQITIANPGTAPAKGVELVAKLPRSLKYVNSNNFGQYDSERHAVTWNLEALPAQEMGTVELTALPIQMGRFPVRVDVKGNMGLSDSVSYDIEIEGMAALLFTVTDVNDPIEVGGDTTYEVQVVNQGSKTATNLRVAALLPDGMEPIRGEGPARGAVDGQRVIFDPLPRLAPQGDTLYRIHVRGHLPGDKRIQVKLLSDDLSQPVTKEESTHVYADD